MIAKLRGALRALARDVADLGDQAGDGGDRCPICNGRGPPDCTLRAQDDREVLAKAPKCPGCGALPTTILVITDCSGPRRGRLTGTVVATLGPTLSLDSLPGGCFRVPAEEPGDHPEDGGTRPGASSNGAPGR
jgi:hypothetical protein